jgi:hypothetical protein
MLHVNFREFGLGEVRRTPIPRTWVNSPLRMRQPSVHGIIVFMEEFLRRLTPMNIVGYLLCFFGLIYVAGGLYKLLVPEPDRIMAPPPNPADVLLALAKLVTALTKAPEWLAACVVGVLLILVGYWLIRQGSRRSPSRTFGE